MPLFDDAGAESNAFLDTRPSLVVAGNNHNIALGDLDALDWGKIAAGATAGAVAGGFAGQAVIPVPILGATIGAIGGAVYGGLVAQSNGKLAVTSLASGANSFYSTGVAIGNFFGAGINEESTEDWLQSIDDSMGIDTYDYYKNNQQLSDISGFMLGMAVPTQLGTATVNMGGRVLATARGGKIGANIAEATGLLAPSMPNFAKLATSEMATGAFSGVNANLLKAYAVKGTDQFIEGAVQTLFTHAMMHKSPVLDEMDAKDVVNDVILGGTLQGVLGSIAEGAKTFGKVKGDLSIIDKSLNKVKFIEGTADGLDSATSMASLVSTRARLEAQAAEAGVESVAELAHSEALTKMGWTADSPESTNLLTQMKQKLEETNRTIRDGVFKAAHGLNSVKGDEAFTNLFSTLTYNIKSSDDAMRSLIGVESIGRAGKLQDWERELNRLSRIKADKITPEEIVARESLIKQAAATSYMDTLTGTELSSRPVALGLADRYNSIRVTKTGVELDGGNTVFSFNKDTPVDILADKPELVDAYRMWVNHNDLDVVLARSPHVSRKEIKLGEKKSIVYEVQATDLPLLQKLMEAGDKAPPFNIKNNLKGIKTESGYLEVEGASLRDVITGIKTQLHKEAAEQIAEYSAIQAKYSGAKLDKDVAKAMHRDMTDKLVEVRAARKVAQEAAAKAKEQLAKARAASMLDPESEAKAAEVVRLKGLADNSKAEAEAAIAEVKLAREQQVASREMLREAQAGVTEAKVMKRRNAEAVADVDLAGLKNKGVAYGFNERLAQRLDVSLSWLENPMDAAATAFESEVRAKKLSEMYSKAGASDRIHPDMVPRYVKIARDPNKVSSLADVESHTAIASLSKIQTDKLRRAAMIALGDEKLAADLDILSPEQIRNTDRFNQSSTFLQGSDAPLGHLGATTQRMNTQTRQIMTKQAERTTVTMHAAVTGIKNSPSEAAELAVIFNKVKRSGNLHGVYVDDLTGDRYLLPLADIAEIGKAEDPAYAATEALASSGIKLTEAQAAVCEAHIARNAERLGGHKAMATAKGNDKMNHIDPAALYVPNPNVNDWPYFAHVIDRSVAGAGRKTTVYAKDEQQLMALISQINEAEPTMEVLTTAKGAGRMAITKAEMERYYKSLGDFDMDQALVDHSMNAQLKAKGVSAEFYPVTNPETFLDNLMDWHGRGDAKYAREIMRTFHSAAFNELSYMGEAFTNYSTSKMGKLSLNPFAKRYVENPYESAIKQALAVQDDTATPMWSAVNDMADSAFSRLWNGIGAGVKAFTAGTKSEAELLADTQAMFKKHGLDTAYQNAALYAHVNHPAGNGKLTELVRASSGLLNALVLAADPMNALNNMVGHNVMQFPEMQKLLSSIRAGNSEAAGELAKLANIKLIGTDADIFSVTKLYGNAIKRKFGGEGKALIERYRADGLVEGKMGELVDKLDQLAITGKETAEELMAKKALADRSTLEIISGTASKWTGNKWAEEFNRFLVVDMIQQIGDVGIKHGVLTPAQLKVYQQSMVNRINGMYEASMRPRLFNGAIGQSIGLFQTYQFNVTQKLLRHIAERDTKSVALMLGLQSTIYGAQSLPGYRFINEHIVNELSANDSRADINSMAYKVLPKEAADWLIYGGGSNIGGLVSPELRFSLYTRGDMNPRTATIVPTNFEEIPVVSAAIKTFSGIKGMTSSMANGGDVWNSFLNGVEHTSLNRPLQGVAAVLNGGSTTANYSKSMSNELLSLTSLVRIAGAKPLDEAKVRDEAYKHQVYEAKDRAVRESLGVAVRTKLADGVPLSGSEVQEFATAYKAAGGKQQYFNRWMIEQQKNATKDQAARLKEGAKDATWVQELLQ